MELLPPMPFAAWQDTKTTLHRFLQVVGKIRLAASVRRNHWWNVPFHLTGRGITSRPMGLADHNMIFTIDFDFVDHQLLVTAGDGRAVSFPLYGRSVAAFYRDTMDALRSLGVHVYITRPVLRYDDARAQTDPRAAVLAFYESAYQAGARLAGWDTGRLTCPGGVTDPHRSPNQR